MPWHDLLVALEQARSLDEKGEAPDLPHTGEELAAVVDAAQDAFVDADKMMPHPVEAASLVFKEVTGKECTFEAVESDLWDLVSVEDVSWLGDGTDIPCDSNKFIRVMVVEDGHAWVG